MGLPLPVLNVDVCEPSNVFVEHLVNANVDDVTMSGPACIEAFN